MIEILNKRIDVTLDEKGIKKLIAKSLRIEESQIISFVFLKKSVDARKKDVFYMANLGVTVAGDMQKIIKKSNNPDVRIYVKKELPKISFCTRHPQNPPVVLGAGPAGLFAALTLAKAGLKPVIFERGDSCENRKEKIDKFFSTGVLDTKTNVQFGEGGAGTFSDGKLTTNIKDIRCQSVLETFYSCGAPKEILYLSKPHLGTDNLLKIVKNIREKIIELGGEVHFLSQITDIKTENNSLSGVIVNNEKEIKTNHLVLASGHSARDVFEMLKKHNVNMEKKPFSIGVRIEHNQKEISKSQYGELYKFLPPADYKLSCHLENGRGVYTFCMCPGGTVVAASSEENKLVVNGMSNFARNGENANSAVLCDVTPADFPSDDVLAGIDFQQKYEEKAFAAGGGNYKAPAQLVKDFMENKSSKTQGSITPSYPLGVTWCNLKDVLPDFAYDSIRQALPIFNNKLHGFLTPDAVLTGIETRSSSPVRVLRNENCQSSTEGIYPCGEGAGYAGGIMSAAVDGIRVAEKIINEFA